MSRAKLTKDNIEKIQPSQNEQMLIWDTTLSGFGVRINPSGRITYIVQSRIGGKNRRVTIGRHGILTVTEARKVAIRELANMTQGIDTAREKKNEELKEITLSRVVKDYLEERTLKERTIKEIHNSMRINFSDWKDRHISEISRNDVMERYKVQTGGVAWTNLAFRNLSSWMNFAMARYRIHEDKPIILENPVKVLSDTRTWKKVRPRNNYIAVDQVGKWWSIIRGIRNSPEFLASQKTRADFFSILLLTGLRLNEATKLTWDRVNYKEKTLYLPDTKSGNSLKLPLSEVSLKILASRPRSCDYVFPKANKNAPIREVYAFQNKIAKITGIYVTPHDLRRTFRAIAKEAGVDFVSTKLLMNHKITGDVTLNYYTDTQNLQWLRPETDRISDWVVKESREYQERINNNSEEEHGRQVNTTGDVVS